MKQYEAVVLAMQGHGGYATLGQLYHSVPKIPNCEWKTKTPFASIRRIVQTHSEFYRVRSGLWALTVEKEKVNRLFASENPLEKEVGYTHSFFQGLLVEIGNLKGFETMVPSQDKNKPFGDKKLSDVTSAAKFFPFTYDNVLKQASTIDVVWFNARHYPNSFFEVEHSTDIQRSLLKFVEFQDFRVNCYIVADNHRKAEFESKISLTAFAPIKSLVKFWNYDAISELHTKITASVLAERALS